MEAVLLLSENGTSASTIVNNTVTVTITVSDASTGSAIQDARVLLEADTGGALPSGDSVSITRSGTTASVSHTAHGLANGAKVVIRGAVQDEYNGIQTISNVSTNAYDYTVSGSPTTPATGTIISTAVIIEGLTNASGVLEDTGFNYQSDQDISGWVRKATTSPLYKQSVVAGTITSGGFSANVLLISDE